MAEGNRPAQRIRAAILDWDGTISTLRCGWEEVMEPMMAEMIDPSGTDEAVREEVRRYVDESTGIQTVFQMQWLEERVRSFGRNPVVHDAWWYKDEYNRRLMERVEGRVRALETGEKTPEDFTIAGSRAFLSMLRDEGVSLYVASGTDHADVVREVEALGFTAFFDRIAGAPWRQAACSKEAVIRDLLAARTVPPEALLLAGDGKVEIRLGKEAGAFALGVASDERQRSGENERKRRRLEAAGADAIIGDFTDLPAIRELLGF